MWMIAMEERVDRQILHIEELEARHDITALPTRSHFEVPPSDFPSVGQSVQWKPHSRLEYSAAESRGHGEEEWNTDTMRVCGEAACAEPPLLTTLSPSRTRAPRQWESTTQQRKRGAHDTIDVLGPSSFECQRVHSNERLTKAEGSAAQCKGASSMADTSRLAVRGVDSFRPTIDDCVALLDSLRTATEGASRTPQLTAETDGTAQLQRQPQANGRYRPMQLRPSQQNTLRILDKLCGALRSIQASYKAATGIGTRVSLETLLQLPPETLPLLMSTDDGTRDACRSHCSHDYSDSPGAAAWCEFLSSTSPYTLRTALIDSVDTLPCISHAAAETLWAAVPWMHACASLTPPVSGEASASMPANRRRDTTVESTAPLNETSSTHTVKGSKGGGSQCQHLRLGAQRSHRTGSASTLQSGPERGHVVEPQQLRAPVEERQKWCARHPSVTASTVRSRLQDDERWAYRVFPVRSGCTAPTVYDDLFPLPTAVSPFVEPPPHTEPSLSLSDERDSGAAATDAKNEKTAAALLNFYTGPARRPRPFV
ncbi:hypothetical protein JKF63_06561 [Porcisia hertigi]|uniref:Uncharacterized protein n=1 Tax=Porcisia hertigi TaxID=2761500 RepID=A0A836HXK2_9TRYP|nr:hypothetical protein JKF63_06561 [Porcisia hertigi]